MDITSDIGTKEGSVNNIIGRPVAAPRLERQKVSSLHNLIRGNGCTSSVGRWKRHHSCREPCTRSQTSMLGGICSWANGRCKTRKRPLTLGSIIFRYRTWIPLVVKYGISNLTLIGRLPLAVWPAPPMLPRHRSSSPLTDGRPSSARIRNSLPPPNCLIFPTFLAHNGRLRHSASSDQYFDIVGSATTLELSFGLMSIAAGCQAFQHATKKRDQQNALHSYIHHMMLTLRMYSREPE
jgi:hypothetical protein